MSFKENHSQQMSISDCIFGLTEREKKALEKSWAKVFADEIFPAIDEKRFAVLYGAKNSRPNTPVNVIIGALIIKELFDYSDDELVENLMLDLHLQYALHTTSFEEQPLSDKTLSRFRKRCYDYEALYGVDLYHECVKDLSQKLSKLMNINGRIRRMDSMMIEANIRKLSRAELLYTCLANLAKVINKLDPNFLPDELKHYTDPNDFNQVMYHQRSTEIEDRLEIIINDIDKLLPLCSETYDYLQEYELLVRCISEQTIIEEKKRRLKTKEDGGFSSKCLHNPSDPDATYRHKAGKGYVGYVANIEESVSADGSIVTDYQYEENTYSDSEFLKDNIRQQDKSDAPVTLVTDGAFYSHDNANLASEKNIKLVPTALCSKSIKEIYADFELDDEGTKVLKCPAGHAPKSCTTTNEGGTLKVSFPISCCRDCPYRNQCKPRMYKKVAKLTISKIGCERAKCQREMNTEAYNAYIRFRNGVETIPSNLRRNFHLDRLPRGKQRSKFFFGSKIMALNFRKLFNYQKGSIKCAENPIFA